jgi:hypothetical protein
MKAMFILRAAVACVFALAAGHARAQTVLALDVNDRSNDTAGNLEAGFTSLVIGSVGSATAIQTQATTRTFGAITLTVSGNGTHPGYDDRLRAVPSNAVSFTQERLLKDFIYSPDTTTSGGLNLDFTGLTPSTLYRVTIWSYDNSSPGTRVSDWFANGAQVIDNYTFSGSVLPTNNALYQFSFTAYSTAGGGLLVQGRRDAATSTAGGVFVNALQIDLTVPDPPTNVSIAVNGPNVYAGDAVIFTAQTAGTAPFTYCWMRDTNVIGTTLGPTFTITNASLTDTGTYSVVVSNLSGIAAASKNSVMLDVFPVTSILDGLIAHWPLDTITDSTLDLTAFEANLWNTNLDASNITGGRIGSALAFNGVDEFLTRTNDPTFALPAYNYPAYTVALWVRGVGIGQADKRVFSESSNTNNSPLLTIGTDVNGTTNVVDIYIRNNNGAVVVNHRKSSLAAFDGTWHHVAWVDNNGLARLYVDGVQDTNNFAYTRGLLTPNIDSLGVVYRTNALALFSGSIDDTAIWRRSLTAEEVGYVFTNGAYLPPGQPALFTTNLVVTETNVSITFDSSRPAGPYDIEQTADLTATPVVWTAVTGVTFAVNGNTVTATFARPPGVQIFFRVRE